MAAPPAPAPAVGRRAPRRASSTRRTRRSAPATSAPARRTPGRRRRIRGFHAMDGLVPSESSDAEFRIAVDRRLRTPARSAMPMRHRISHGIVPMAAAISRTSMRSPPCAPEDHHLVAGRRRRARDVDHHHVHAHGADDRRAPAAHEHVAAPGEPRVEAVGVAGGHDRDLRGTLGHEPRAVAHDFARPHALDRDDAAARAT